MATPSAFFCIAAFATSAGFYLLLAGATSQSELITAAVVATASTGLAAVLRLREEHPIRLSMPPLRFLIRPLLALFLDGGRVGLVLVRAILRRPAGEAGTVSPQPLRHGDAPRERGRQALVMLATSLAPNGYVLDQPRGEASMVMHRLAPTRPDPDAEWPT